MTCIDAMSIPYTCLSCRLQVFARRRVRLDLQTRRLVSQSNQQRQGLQSAHFNRRANGAEFQRGARASEHANEQREGQSPRGRYSGRKLAPEQLLHQLETTAGEPKIERPSRQAASQRFQRPAPRNKPVPEESADHEALLEPPLRHILQVSQTLKGDPPPSVDEQFWKAMKEIMPTYRNPENAALLFGDAFFRKQFNYWTVRVRERWLQTTFNSDRGVFKLPRNQRSDEQLLTPYETFKCKYFLNPNPGIALPLTIWIIAREVAEYLSTHTESSQSTNVTVREGIQELMRLWHISMAVNICGHEVVHPSGPSPRWSDILDRPTLNWSFLPDPTNFAATLRDRAQTDGSKVSLGYALDMLVVGSQPGGRPRRERGVDVESCAILTLGSLEQMRSRPGGDSLVEEYQPWTRIVQSSMKSVNAPHVPAALARRMMELERGDPRHRFYQDLVQEMKLSPASTGKEGAIGRAWEESTSINGAEELHDTSTVKSEERLPDEFAKVPVPDDSSSQSDRLTYLSIKRLGRAVEQFDIRAAERVRQDIADFKSRNPGVVMPLALYENMIYTFLRLRSIRTSVTLWEEMVKGGHVPRINTYTSMMRGSQHLKDLASMEYFWNEMKGAGIQPDGTAWSTRLAGLFAHNHTDAGLKALSEMGQNWLLAAKQSYLTEQDVSPKRKKAPPTVTAAQLLAKYAGDIKGVPRPDVVIMNSAITHCSRGPDHLIPKILTWGRSFGIEPDIITYNAFLAVATKHNQGEEALKILQRMRAQNFEVDRNTWNIVIADMLAGGFLNGLSAPEQEAKILEFLSAVDTDGEHGLDLKGYALLIDRLLKDYENHPAAQAVLAYMTSKGIEVGRHIYTIVMSSHLDQDPPNFAAADALFEYIQSAEGGYGAHLDSKFYDLVIKGYAPHCAVIGTDKILACLNKMDDEGKRPSWSALEASSRALAETSQWTRLAQIVDKTRRRLRDEKGIDTGPGQYSFWQFVISTGMLRHEKITMPEQIMGISSEQIRRR